jgi:glutathione S-transferase
MMILWGRLNSHNVKKIAWFCEEAGIAHDRRDVGGPFGFPDDYRAKNPNMLIPTIEDDGLVLWESNAILRYLAARHAPAFWPQEPAVRALGDRWMDWQAGYATAQFGAFWNLVRRKPDERIQSEIDSSVQSTAKLMKVLDDALAATPWLSGDRFGIGDIPMGVYTHTYLSLDIDRPDLPHVRAWYDKLRQRPGYAAKVMIPLT